MDDPDGCGQFNRALVKGVSPHAFGLVGILRGDDTPVSRSIITHFIDGLTQPNTAHENNYLDSRPVRPLVYFL
jgi:hypothetical protein